MFIRKCNDWFQMNLAKVKKVTALKCLRLSEQRNTTHGIMWKLPTQVPEMRINWHTFDVPPIPIPIPWTGEGKIRLSLNPPLHDYNWYVNDGRTVGWKCPFSFIDKSTIKQRKLSYNSCVRRCSPSTHMSQITDWYPGTEKVMWDCKGTYSLRSLATFTEGYNVPGKL